MIIKYYYKSLFAKGKYNLLIKEYYRNGKLHKDNGPAVEYSNGHKEWWINDNFIKHEK